MLPASTKLQILMVRVALGVFYYYYYYWKFV